MKLESLQLEKFKEKALKREQMFQLNGGGIVTGPGNICAPHGPAGRWMNFDYGYDAYRDGITTYHNRTNIKDTCIQPG